MKLALYQGAGAPARPAENRATMARVAEECAALGCGLVVFPELFASGYNISDEVLDLAEALDGATAAVLSKAASDNGIAILAGYPERAGDWVYNAAMLMGPDGAMLANARKTHLFGPEERRLFAPGESLTLARLGDLSMGILICYDVEFPEAVRALALGGAALVAVPTALMRPHERVAERLVPVRAFENQVFVAYANRCGREGTLDYCGASCIVGPDGVELARAGPDEALLTADVDPAAYEQSRRDNPYLIDRRPELYASLVEAPQTGGNEA